MTRIIKRYENRKLYDTEARAYVSLSDIAAIVRRGETVQVVDNRTGEDLTAQTLMQILLDEGRKGGRVLPTDLLHDLLRRSGEAFEAGVASLRQGVDELIHSSMGRLGAYLHRPRANELEALRAQLGQLERMLGRLLETQEETRNETIEGDNHGNEREEDGASASG